MRVKVLLALAVVLTMAACDDGGGDIFYRPLDPFLDLTSPENVLNNTAACFVEMDYDHMVPIIHDGFQFFFWSGDVGAIPGDLGPGSYWSQGEFLGLMSRMLDEGFVPCDTLLEIKSMTMTLTLSGDLTDSNLEGAPLGAQKAYVNLDLAIHTVGAATYVVHSRPLFYFVPDSTHADTEDVTWQLWRVDDVENLNNPEYERVSFAVRDGAPAGGVPGSPGARQEAAPAAPVASAFEPLTWGHVISIFCGPCE